MLYNLFVRIKEEKYLLDLESFQLMKPVLIILHPGPKSGTR